MKHLKFSRGWAPRYRATAPHSEKNVEKSVLMRNVLINYKAVAVKVKRRR